MDHVRQGREQNEAYGFGTLHSWQATGVEDKTGHCTVATMMW